MEVFGHLGTWKESKNTFTIYGAHGIKHEFLFLGLDKPADVKRAKSLDVADFMGDEASELVIDIFLALQGRKGRHPKIEGKAKVPKLFELIDPLGLLVSNPPEDEHFLVEEFETNRKAGYEQFLQPSGLSLLPHR